MWFTTRVTRAPEYWFNKAQGSMSISDKAKHAFRLNPTVAGASTHPVDDDWGQR